MEAVKEDGTTPSLANESRQLRGRRGREWVDIKASVRMLGLPKNRERKKKKYEYIHMLER